MGRSHLTVEIADLVMIDRKNKVGRSRLTVEMADLEMLTGLTKL